MNLDRKLRGYWDARMKDEGAALGISDCRPFLENKLVNDIFYEGLFKGTPCIVKCSSRAPESITNEYEISQRLSAADPGVCAEALAHWTAKDGRSAFVVTRKLPGPSLTDLFTKGLDEEESIGVMDDLLRIAAALQKSGIVWRDIISDNLLMDADGHLRLIDGQFAFLRAEYHEDPYLMRHWRYRMLLFAHHPMMAGHGWNDVGMLLFLTLKLAKSFLVDEWREQLRGMVAASAFPVKYGKSDIWRMRITLLWLKLCRMVPHGSRKDETLRTRIARAQAFISRDSGRWNDYLYR